MTLPGGRITGFTRIALACTAFATFSVAEGGVIMWSGNTFNHTAYGGSGASSGWQAGMQGGSTLDTASGVTMTAVHQRVNSNAGTNNMSLQPFGAGATPPTFLYWAITSDYEGGGTLDDYSTMTLSFSSAVTVTGFAIRDVDDGGGTSWQDFVAVRAQNGATNVGVTYALGNGGTDQDLHARFGLNGVLGVNDLNYPSTDPDAANADVGITFGASITTMTVTFLQGPQGSQAANHLIFLNNLTITPVPEPSTYGMIGLAALVFLGRRRFRRIAKIAD
jgi:hypothetical protein